MVTLWSQNATGHVVTRPGCSSFLALLVLSVLGCGSSASRDADILAADDRPADSAPPSTTKLGVAPSFSTRDGSFVASVLPSGVDVVVVDHTYENPVGDRLHMKIYSDRPSGPPMVIVTVNRGSEARAGAQDLAAQAASRVEVARALAVGDPVEVKGFDALVYRPYDEPNWTHLLWQEGHATVDVAGYRRELPALVQIAEGLRATEGVDSAS